MGDVPNIPGQTAIEEDKVGDGKKEVRCEWCQELPTRPFECLRKIKGGRPGASVGTGMFLYACEKHAHLADEIAKDLKLRKL